MDPVSIAVLGSVAVGGAMQAAGSIMAGQEQAVASKFEAQQLQRQAGQFKTVAAQAEAVRREDLSSTLQSIMAIRAGRGVGMSSPTGMAIYDHAIEGEERNIATEKLNYLQSADTARQQALLARRRGKASLLAGYMGAGDAVAGAVYKGASPYLKPR